jgi:hypothetical protein
MVKYTEIYSEQEWTQDNLLHIPKQRFLNISMAVVRLRDPLKIILKSLEF